MSLDLRGFSPGPPVHVLFAQALQFLALVFRTGVEFSFTQPVAAATQFAGRMDPARVPGLAARTDAALGRRRRKLLSEDLKFRRIKCRLPVFKPAHQVLYIRGATRALGQLIDECREFDMQLSGRLEEAQGCECGGGARGKRDANAVGDRRGR